MLRQIYFAKCGDRIKVGISNNVGARLSQLRTGAGAPVELLAAVDGDNRIERALHNKLKQYRVDGEWFRDCPETRAAIQNSLNNFPKAIVYQPRKLGVNRTFPSVAKLLWPFKTAEHIAAIAHTDARTARRWLAGESDVPAIVIAAIVVEITRRDEQ